MTELSYDAVIIGFGKGEKTLAAQLAKVGKTVALAEMDENMYGGTCINVGCIPSKSLITSAAKTDAGADFEKKAQHFYASIQEKQRLTAMLRGKNFDKLDSLENITIYTGHARFSGDRQVEVTTADGLYRLNAQQIFINTGSNSRIPPIEGIQPPPGVYTSSGLMDLKELPRKLVILGGGYIGLKFASMFAAFGSEVIVLQESHAFLPREDEDVAAEIRAELERQGIAFRSAQRPQKLKAAHAVRF